MYIKHQDFKRDEKGGRELLSIRSVVCLRENGGSKCTQKREVDRSLKSKLETCFSTKLNFVLSGFIQAHVRIDCMNV